MQGHSIWDHWAYEPSMAYEAYEAYEAFHMGPLGI